MTTTDFTYYEQFKFTLKEIEALEWYIDQKTPPTDLKEVEDLLLEVQEFNDFMNQLNDEKIPTQYGDLVLTTKIKDYELKLLEKVKPIYEKVKSIKDKTFTDESGITSTSAWEHIIKSSY